MRKGIMLIPLAWASLFAQPYQGKFVIGTWWDPPMSNNAQTDRNRLWEFRNGGFNTLTGIAGRDADFNVYKADKLTGIVYKIDRASEVDGTQYVVFDHRFEQTASDAVAAAIVNDYTTNLSSVERSVVIGYNVMDEATPGANANAPYVTLDNLNAWNGYLAARDPNRFAWGNLLPYAPNLGFTWSTYTDYVQKYMNTGKTRIASYDFYEWPEVIGGTYTWLNYAAAESFYFRNLKLFADNAGARGMHWWAYPLAVKHPAGFDNLGRAINYLAPTQNNMRFLANMPLAYGAKGLIWFTYDTPNVTGYNTAMFDPATGQTTAIYQYAKNVNLPIERMGTNLMNLVWRETIHGSSTENSSNPPSNEPVATAQTYGPTMISFASLYFAVGKFDGNGLLSGTPMFYVVNKDRVTTRSTSITVSGNYTVRTHQKTKTKWIKLASTYDSGTNRTTFPVSNVLPGDAQLIRFDPPGNPTTFGINNWNGPNTYGGSDAVPVPADYDGDGWADLAVKTSAGVWNIDFASNGFGKWDYSRSGYGDASSIPVPADYDGDGKADLSVKTANGQWLIDYAANGFGAWETTVNNYGNSAAHPVPADYDGDGKADLSVKTDDGQWMVDKASNGFGIWDISVSNYGNSASHPVPADYDGDGLADMAVKTDDGKWLIDKASNGFGVWDITNLTGYGNSASTAVPADYDGDGKADLAVKITNGQWLIDYAANGFGVWQTSLTGYGDGSALPVPADYDGDGKTDLAVKTTGGVWNIDQASR